MLHPSFSEHLHHEIKHQGRHFTQGIVRAKGYWIIGGKRPSHLPVFQVSKTEREVAKSEDGRPTDRTINTSPSVHIRRFRCLRPWQLTTRKTRGGAAQSKRWAVVFTCLTIREIHIELIESMDTSSFINALRRFFAVMGPVVWCHIYKKLKRCDLCLHKKYVIICQPKLSSLNRRISLSHYGQNLPFLGYCLSSLKSFRQLKQCE